MFHKEGYPSIFIATLLSAGLVWIGGAIESSWFKYIPASIGLILLVLVLQFFRNPSRSATHNDKAIASPSDGKVVQIVKVTEDEFLGDERMLISVFMSPLNVHVTRYPCDGEVVYSHYHPGKYLVAWHPKSSTLNERTTVAISHKNNQHILYRQIAGALARRIVNYAKKGGSAAQGKDAGFIKFGSRIDIYLPLDASIKVEVGQKVQGGRSVLAELS